MKTLCLIAGLSFSSLCSAADYVYVVKNFPVTSPRPDILKEHIKAKTGNCAVVDWDLRYEGARSLIVHGLSAERDLEGSELDLTMRGEDLSFFINPCGKTTGYRSSIKDHADGSRTLSVTCKGNSLEGRGSGELILTVDAKKRLKALRLVKKEGWWESFRRITLDCSF